MHMPFFCSVQELSGSGLFGGWPEGLFAFLDPHDRLRGGQSESDEESDHEDAVAGNHLREAPPVQHMPEPAFEAYHEVAAAAIVAAAEGAAGSEGGEQPPAAPADDDAADVDVPGQPQRRRAIKAGTGRWFLSNRAKPITPDHSVSIIEACHWLATLKSSSRMTDEAVDKICLMIHKFLLPEGNYFPPSYHIVKATLGVDSSAACTDHICDKCWSVFPRLSPASFAAHADDVCNAVGLPGCLSGPCGNPRFNKSETGVLAPKRSFYQFDVADTVHDLLEVAFGNLPEVLAQRRADFSDPATFWGSPAGKQLDTACGHKFTNPAEGEVAMVFSLGMAPCRHAAACCIQI